LVCRHPLSSAGLTGGVGEGLDDKDGDSFDEKSKAAFSMAEIAERCICAA